MDTDNSVGLWGVKGYKGISDNGKKYNTKRFTLNCTNVDLAFSGFLLH